MIIRNFKKNIVLASVGLIIVGMIISIIGLGVGGFKLDNFKSDGRYKWYRTIGNDSDNFYVDLNF